MIYCPACAHPQTPKTAKASAVDTTIDCPECGNCNVVRSVIKNLRPPAEVVSIPAAKLCEAWMAYRGLCGLPDGHREDHDFSRPLDPEHKSIIARRGFRA